MIRFFPVCLLLAGCAIFNPEPDLPPGPPIGPEKARHLLERSGFNAPPAQITRLAQLDQGRAAWQLLSAPAKRKTAAPDWVKEWEFQPRRELTAEERMAQNRQYQERGQELKAWWLEEMRVTPNPLAERMTLFWHKHFTSSLDKVRIPQGMYRQNVTLRHHALGNFSDLLFDIAHDPAMLVYLDGARNVAGKPNENFAREVMELFTLGEGHYSENDIREAARAFTGWGVDMDFGEFIYRRNLHDDGVKTFLGRSGRFDGDDILRIILDQAQTSEFIVGKLWLEFISPTPDPVEVRRLAKLFRTQRYEIKSLLLAMFTTPAFHAAETRGQLVKSPVELIIGTLREFNLQPRDWQPFLNTARQMGQDLLNPPNVKGWPGGDWWINSQTLAVRQQFISRITRGDGRGPLGQLEPDYAAWLARCDADCSSRTLLPLPPASKPQGNPAQIIRTLLADPRYQLK